MFETFETLWLSILDAVAASETAATDADRRDARRALGDASDAVHDARRAGRISRADYDALAAYADRARAAADRRLVAAGILPY